MITNFQVSKKTCRPACCDWFCCGNKFGRIERSKYVHIHARTNRVKKSRRYAKHVEKSLIRLEIQNQITEME